MKKENTKQVKTNISGRERLKHKWVYSGSIKRNVLDPPTL